MVRYLVSWRAKWFIAGGSTEVSGEFSSRSLSAISQEILGVVSQTAPADQEKLLWEEPFFFLAYSVSRVVEKEGMSGLDLLAEREEATRGDIVVESIDSLEGRGG